jgi:hypothetical protein
MYYVMVLPIKPLSITHYLRSSATL